MDIEAIVQKYGTGLAGFSAEELLRAALTELAAWSVSAVPVMGEVVAWACPFHAGEAVVNDTPCMLIGARNVNAVAKERGFPLVVKPTTSITTAELERLRKDAERYRWLKESSHYYIGEAYDCDCCGTAEDFTSYCDQNDLGLDAHIDAAIAAEGEKK